jgi:hypothetical protein
LSTLFLKNFYKSGPARMLTSRRGKGVLVFRFPKISWVTPVQNFKIYPNIYLMVVEDATGRKPTGGFGLQPLAHDPAAYVWGEKVKRSIDWLIKRLIKVGAKVP